MKTILWNRVKYLFYVFVLSLWMAWIFSGNVWVWSWILELGYSPELFFWWSFGMVAVISLIIDYFFFFRILIIIRRFAIEWMLPWERIIEGVFVAGVKNLKGMTEGEFIREKNKRLV